MDRVALLYAEITAAARAFLSALAESDRHRDWAGEGFGSCSEWLTWRLGITRNTANEKIRVAHALEVLPRTADAMARGELSFSKVRALTRVATPVNEAELLTYARAVSAAGLERFVRGWREIDGEDEAARERRLHARRTLSVFPGEDGMYVVRGRLMPEVAAVLMRAVDAAADTLYAEQEDDRGEVLAGSYEVEEADRRAAARRRADALGLLAERALAAGFGGESDAPRSGSRAERYQVIVHMAAEATDKTETASAVPHLDDGTAVTAATARRLACDASRVDVTHASDGSIAGVGRRTRTVPPSLRRALQVRDGGCRFPGCASRFTDAHHIVHWADGGSTRLDNLLLLCRRHHRRVHEGGVTVCMDRDRHVVFFNPDGRAIAGAPPIGLDAAERRPGWPKTPDTPNSSDAPDAPDTADTTPVTPDAPDRPDAPATPNGAATPNAAAAAADRRQHPDTPAEPLLRRNRARGVHPAPRTNHPPYAGDRFIPWSVEAAAWEAVDQP